MLTPWWQNGLSTIPLQIWIAAPHMACADAFQMVQDTQQALDDLNEYPILHQRLHLVQRLSSNLVEDNDIPRWRMDCGADPLQLSGSEPALNIILEPGGDTYKFELQPRGSIAKVQFPDNSKSAVPTDLAQSLNDLFKSEQIAAALHIVSLASNSHQALAFLKSQPYSDVAEIERQLGRAFKSSPTYHLTFSLFTAEGVPSNWDIRQALSDHIDPLVRALSRTANFSITSQIQLYSPFSPAIRPQTEEGREGRFLEQHDLTAFVNAAEWPLSPSIGSGPTVNFILYVPARDQTPLRIKDHEGTSWLIPQWGGILILNPPLLSAPVTGLLAPPSQLSRDVLGESFETFSAQLLSLLGVLQSDFEGRPLPLQFRLQAHTRLTVFTLYLKAASSLGSLARLAQHLNNIPIPRHVSQLVENTISNLTASTHAFQESRWNAALAHATLAFEDSERAFFDKSMVGQVYFPDEHKVAVYLPLLGPIGVPLLVGLLREVRKFVSGIRQAKR